MTVSEQESAVAVEQARLATNKHYELPPEVFAAFLDKRLKYISGLFLSQDATLEEAQTAKPTKHYALTATRSRMGI